MKKSFFNAVDECIHLTITFFAQGHPKQQVIHLHGATLVLTESSSPFFNHIIGCKLPRENTREKVLEIHQPFISKNLSFSWWIGPNHSPKNLKEVLISENLKHQSKANILLHNLIKEVSFKKNLTIKKISSEKDLQQFFSLQALSRKVPDLFSDLYTFVPSLYQENQPVEFYVGYFQGKPVACGGLTTFAKVAQIHSLCTHSHFQGQGHATEMIRFLMEKAKSVSCETAFLLCSEALIPFYAKFGFNIFGCFDEYCF